MEWQHGGGPGQQSAEHQTCEAILDHSAPVHLSADCRCLNKTNPDHKNISADPSPNCWLIEFGTERKKKKDYLFQPLILGWIVTWYRLSDLVPRKKRRSKQTVANSQHFCDTHWRKKIYSCLEFHDFPSFLVVKISSFLWFSGSIKYLEEIILKDCGA